MREEIKSAPQKRREKMEKKYPLMVALLDYRTNSSNQRKTKEK